MSNVPRLLVVCTANRCRSPLGEVIARDISTTLGVELDVDSAGVSAIEGLPPTGGTELAARRLGLDVTEILSKPTTPDIIEWADLVVCMERRHVIDLVAEHPASFPRTFLLTELEGWTDLERPDGSQNLRQWLDAVAARRTAANVVAGRGVGDIDDPAGRSLRRHHKAAEQIRGHLHATLSALAPVLGIAQAPDQP